MWWNTHLSLCIWILFIDDKTLVLAISQSGETIDTLEALKYARSQGAKSIAVINVKGSSIARESDYVMYTYAGPEIAVASTKAYTTQMAALFALIGRMAVVRGAFNEEQEKAFVDALMQAPDAIQQVLDRKEEMHHHCQRPSGSQRCFHAGSWS